MLTDIGLSLLGHIATSINNIVGVLLGKGKHSNQIVSSGDLDKTGRVASKATSIKVLYKDEKSSTIFVLYEKLFAHSLWRSQEFSLFMNKMKFIAKPVLDFGCGDGSFASVIFSDIEYGADIDEEALSIAKQYKIYAKTILIPAATYRLSIETETIGSVYCNSVLEHVSNLDFSLSEIHRILRPDGIFMFTVPVKNFTEHLTKYFGSRESLRINQLFCHRNLLSKDEWVCNLREQGFYVVSITEYQPSWFTFIYRLLFMSGLGRLSQAFILKYWQYFKEMVINAVYLSITNTTNGGNIFVVAQKMRNNNLIV